MNLKILWVFLAVGILLGVARGDEKEAHEHHLSEWKFGETLFGSRVVPTKLDGRVVVLEYWGVGCASCFKGLGNLAAIDEKYRGKGVVVIGAEAYRSDRATIAEVLKEQKVNFSITDGVTGPISVSDLPYAVVFAPDGRVIYHGHPNNERFEAVIIKAAGDFKDLKKIAERVGKRVGAGNLIAQRSWKNSEGKPLVAAIKKIEGQKVHFILSDGREFPYKIEKLSKKDQEFIKDTVRKTVEFAE